VSTISATSDSIGRTIAIGVVITALALLRKYLPAPKRNPPARPITEREASEFRRLQWLVNIAIFVTGVAFAVTSYKLLILANRAFAESDGAARFQLLPTKSIWSFFPGFGALSLAWEITIFLWTLLGNKEKAHRYVQWSNEKAGFDSTRTLRWMTIGIALPIGIATLLALPMRSTLRDPDLLVCGYARLTPRQYSYSQARRLLVVDGFRRRDGTFVSRADVILEFADGYHWHSANNRDFSSTVDPAMLKFLAEKTGLSVERWQTEADLNH
jgi:hypothetical protein